MLPDKWIRKWQLEKGFERLFAIKGEVFSEQQGRKTIGFTYDKEQYFAKFHRGIGCKEILGDIFRLRMPVVGAQNEWKAILHLKKLNIDTIELVGYGKSGFNPARLNSFVITKELKNTVSLEDFCSKWEKDPPDFLLKRAIIAKVANIARILHQNGVNHRDFYICHFLLNNKGGSEKIDPASVLLYLIDLHRAQIRRKTPVRWKIKDIASLFFSSMNIKLSKKDLFRFIKIYTNKPLRWVFDEDKTFWNKVNKRAVKTYKKFHKIK